MNAFKHIILFFAFISTINLSGNNRHGATSAPTSMRTADTTAVKNDWKRIVDNFKVTNNGDDQPYLYHKGKPLVCLWWMVYP
ncbi:MAG: hypothetical protein BWY67_01559 [Bacteroidetes bacterium ADurb.Bin397]|nr:MAG: hypothetical protein BWY67_01559 [Bacteroidetes bacterium ADurb.Bin397]